MLDVTLFSCFDSVPWEGSESDMVRPTLGVNGLLEKPKPLL